MNEMNKTAAKEKREQAEKAMAGKNWGELCKEAGVALASVLIDGTVKVVEVKSALLELLREGGYIPTDAELTAAGITRAEAEAIAALYNNQESGDETNA